MLTTDQELFIEMIDQIDEKENKAKYIRKILEQNIKPKSKNNLANSYKMKGIIQQGHICKKSICIKTSFLLVKNISHQIVLGTPFLTQLYPFSIDSQGLKTKYNNQEILFEFIKGIEVKEINQVQDCINLLQQKQ